MHVAGQNYFVIAEGHSWNILQFGAVHGQSNLEVGWPHSMSAWRPLRLLQCQPASTQGVNVTTEMACDYAIEVSRPSKSHLTMSFLHSSLVDCMLAAAGALLCSGDMLGLHLRPDFVCKSCTATFRCSNCVRINTKAGGCCLSFYHVHRPTCFCTAQEAARSSVFAPAATRVSTTSMWPCASDASEI